MNNLKLKKKKKKKLISPTKKSQNLKCKLKFYQE